jgi:hypothetical protein
MMSIELFIISALRAVVEVAGLFLLGQGALYLLAGAGRENNAMYRFFCLVTRPLLRLVRFVTPRVVVDRHLPLVALVLLFWAWIALALAKRLL